MNENVVVNKLNTGDILSEQQYYVVKRVDIMRRVVVVVNDHGDELAIGYSIVERDMCSADQFDSEQLISRTEIIKLIMSAPNTAMTVNFSKKPDKKQVTEDLYAIYANKRGKIITESVYKKKVKEIIDGSLSGEIRTMRGRHFGYTDGFGRLSFIDMDKTRDIGKTYDTRTRLVDPRTVNWVIIKNVKYIVN